MKRYRFSALFIVSLLGAILSTWIATAQTGDPVPQIAYHSETGQATFISASPSADLVPLPGMANPAVGGSSSDKAQLLLSSYAPLFGISNPAQDLQFQYELQPDAGTITRRYQQTYNGVPVLAGELIVNMTASGKLMSINGEASPNLNLSTVPQVANAVAQQTALGAIAKWYGLSTADLTASQPSLWIYDARLLKPSTDPVRLVWRVEVTPVQALPLKELVLVDAVRGGIVLNFNQIDTIKGFASPVEMRQMNAALKLEAHTTDQQVAQLELEPRVPGSPDLATYTVNNMNVPLPGTLLCTEAQVSCTNGTNAHADGAHRFAREAYMQYWNNHGRDSINGAGMQIVSTVNYQNSDCNAFWNGNQMVYHNSCFLAVDDVVGHELTHGVTQHTSGLFYYYQSGAINESLSDVWGEALDQGNGAGNDSAGVRWHLAEDSSIGALRFMDNPPEDGYSPDRIQSPIYWKDSQDNGGVHINSGVNNKAVYLMVDGGTFNGRTVTGIGFTKVLKVYYRVQTTMLVSGSDYQTLYNGLIQSCNALIGTSGITANDCLQVKTAAEAVEMHLLPTGDFMPSADICPVGQVPNYLFFDNRETLANNYTATLLFGTGITVNQLWYPNDSGYSNSGIRQIFGANVEKETDSVLTMNNSIALPSNASLHFDHAFQFEAGYDGGILQYSTNGGGSWSNASTLFSQGQNYNGTISPTDGNPLAGQSAFTGESHGYVSSRYNLASLTGQSVRFRWRIGNDALFKGFGWVIDDIKIYTCGVPTATPIPPTSTPIPPTSTPIPPTGTPIPPTNTPVQPTNTPGGPTETPVVVTDSPPTATVTPGGNTGVEILVNGGFEIAGDSSKLAASWTAKNLTTNDKRKCNKDGKPPVAQQGTCAFQLKGDAGVKSALKQKPSLVGTAGDTFTLSGWVNAKKLGTGGSIVAKVKYADGTKGTINLAMPTGTYAYTKLANSLVLTGAPQKIVVQVKAPSSGKALVDGVSLLHTQSNGLLETLPLGLGQ